MPGVASRSRSTRQAHGVATEDRLRGRHGQELACACDRGEKPVKAGKNAWRCVKIAVIDPPRNKDSRNKPDVRGNGHNKSVKIGKAKAGVSNRSSSSMPR